MAQRTVGTVRAGASGTPFSPLFRWPILVLGLLATWAPGLADEPQCPAAPAKVAQWLEEAENATVPPWQRFVPSSAAKGYCSFYELGWRSFIYLMQDVEAGDVSVPRFLTWKTASDTFPAVVGLGNKQYGLAFRPTAWDGLAKPPRTGPINKTGVLVEQAKPVFPLYTPDGVLTEFGVRRRRRSA